jgi:hypothetical protein
VRASIPCRAVTIVADAQVDRDPLKRAATVLESSAADR